MCDDKLLENVEDFIKIIYNWPKSTIKKKVLLQLIEQLCSEDARLKKTFKELSVSKESECSSNSRSLNISGLVQTFKSIKKDSTATSKNTYNLQQKMESTAEEVNSSNEFQLDNADRDQEIQNGIYETFNSMIGNFESIKPDYLDKFPSRPPPRPNKPVSPKCIYVCLYDHNPTTNDSHEIAFKCGDVLYIINEDGPNFYVGHKLRLSSNSDESTPIGLVCKDYITPAYEKIH